jgi:hypothetical protein
MCSHRTSREISGSNSGEYGAWRQYTPLKRRSISTKLRDATSQKAAIIIESRVSYYYMYFTLSNIFYVHYDPNNILIAHTAPYSLGTDVIAAGT